MKNPIRLHTITRDACPHLIGILQDKVFPRRLAEAGVNDGIENPPAVANIKCHLLCQLGWFNLLHTQNLVLGRVSRMLTRDIAIGDGTR